MDQIQIAIPSPSAINIVDLLINLGFCIAASFLLRYVYVHRSISLSGKFHIGTVIPMLACVTFLVIMVVKSSLALSLGLVGALSVIRFRTPIKEPEELAYLFLAIAIGLGFGAGQTLVTTTVFLVVLILIIFWLSRKSVTFETEYSLHVDWTGTNLSLNSILDKIQTNVTMAELQKYNTHDKEQSAFLKINVHDISGIEKIVESMKSLDPKVSCSFYEARPLQ